MNRPIFILILFLLFISGCSDNEKNAQSYIDSARNYMSKGKAANAAIEYRNAIKQDSENDIACFELAETYILLQKVQSAIRSYRQAVLINPDNITARLRLAQIYLRQDRLFESRKMVMEVLQKNPNSISGYHLLSRIQIKERDIDAAVETLEKACHLDGSTTKTRLSLARLYMRMKRFDKAEALYLEVIELDEKDRDAYNGLVRLYKWQEKWEEIEKLLLQVIETPGIQPEKHYDLAEFYAYMGKFDKAEKYYNVAVEKADNKTPFLMGLAEYFARRGHELKAVNTVEKALTIERENPLVLIALVKVHLAFGKIDKAEELIGKVLQRHPNLKEGLVQKGRILFYKREFASAFDYFETVLNKDRFSADAYYYKALCLERNETRRHSQQEVYSAAAGLLDDPETFVRNQVKENLKAALAIDPDMLNARTKLAHIYLTEKDVSKAAEQIKAIHRLAPGRRKTAMLITGLKILQGEKKEALAILKQMAAHEPESFAVNARMGLLYKSMKKHDQAVESLKRAYEIDTSAVGILKFIVDIYIEQEKYQQAYEVIKHSMDGSNGLSAAIFENLMGEIKLKNGETGMALIHFKKAQAIYPQYIKPLLHSAKLFMENEQYDKALDDYRKAVDLDPDNLSALKGIGYIYDLRGNLTKAQIFYDRILDINPFHAIAANNLAFILAEKNENLDKAMKLAVLARRKRPKDPNVLDTIGWVYYKKGSFRTAVSELKESLNINPNNPLACYHMGMALYRSGHYEEARHYLNLALKLDPGFRGSESARAMLN